MIDEPKVGMDIPKVGMDDAPGLDKRFGRIVGDNWS